MSTSFLKHALLGSITVGCLTLGAGCMSNSDVTSSMYEPKVVSTSSVVSVTSTPSVSSTTQAFVDQTYGVRFEYPEVMRQVSPDQQLYASFFSPKAEKVVSFTFPDSFTTTTNLKNAGVEVYIEPSSTCSKLSGVVTGAPDELATLAQHYLTPQITVEGGVMNLEQVADAAAGSATRGFVYSGMHGRSCYHFGLFTTATNLNNYDPASRPQAFDAKQLLSIFAGIMHSSYLGN